MGRKRINHWSEMAVPENKNTASARWYHRTRFAIIERLGWTCIECKRGEGVEIHHIEGTDLPNSRPLAERIRDWKRGLKEGDLCLLCPECHYKMHHEQEFEIDPDERINRYHPEDIEKDGSIGEIDR